MQLTQKWWIRALGLVSLIMVVLLALALSATAQSDEPEPDRYPATGHMDTEMEQWHQSADMEAKMASMSSMMAECEQAGAMSDADMPMSGGMPEVDPMGPGMSGMGGMGHGMAGMGSGMGGR